MIIDPASPGTGVVLAGRSPDVDSRLREAALALEASFLSEMLKSAGLGKAGESFNGGAGEEHFSSFLRDAQTKELARAGGIGLAQTLFEAMAGAPDEAAP